MAGRQIGVGLAGRGRDGEAEIPKPAVERVISNRARIIAVPEF